MTAEAYRAELGVVIRERRASLGWTQQELSTSLGLRGRTVANYERGDTDMSVTRLVEITARLGTRPGELLTVVDSRIGVPRVDLVALSRSTNPDLAAAVRWARVRLAAGDPVVVSVSADAAASLAVVSGLSQEEWALVFRAFAPRANRKGEAG